MPQWLYESTAFLPNFLPTFLLSVSFLPSFFPFFWYSFFLFFDPVFLSQVYNGLSAPCTIKHLYLLTIRVSSTLHTCRPMLSSPSLSVAAYFIVLPPHLSYRAATDPGISGEDNPARKRESHQSNNSSRRLCVFLRKSTSEATIFWIGFSTTFKYPNIRQSVENIISRVPEMSPKKYENVSKTATFLQLSW